VPGTWLSVRVELIEGRDRRGGHAPGGWLQPAATPSSNWPRPSMPPSPAGIPHLHEFGRQDGERVGRPDPDPDEDDAVLDDRTTTQTTMGPYLPTSMRLPSTAVAALGCANPPL